MVKRLDVVPEVIAQVDMMDLKIPDKVDQFRLLQEKYLLGHFSAEAIIQALREDRLIWPMMKKDTIELVKQCRDCQRFNVIRQGFHPLRSIHAELPRDH